jgi:hypothetical protein
MGRAEREKIVLYKAISLREKRELSIIRQREDALRKQEAMKAYK